MKSITLALICALSVLLFSCGGGGGDPVIPVDDYVNAGKTAMLGGDGVTAKSNFQTVLEHAPDNPAANFGMAFVELMATANDMVAFLSVQNDPAFRNVGWFALNPLMKSTGKYSELLDLSRMLAWEDDYIIEDIPLEDVRLEIVAMIQSLEIIEAYLDIAIRSTRGDDSWEFTILKDWNDPSAGSITITRGDIMALSAALGFALGSMHLTVAYTPGPLTIHQNQYGEIELVGGFTTSPDEFIDTSLDGFIDLWEIAVQCDAPAGFGVHATDGQTHLNKTAFCIEGSLTRLRDAIDSYLSVDAPLNHWAFEEVLADEYNEFKENWFEYIRDYVEDMMHAFANGATFAIRPGLLEDNPDLADDPGADFSIKVNFNAFITHLPQDMRNFPIRLTSGLWDQLEMPVAVGDAFPDLTVLGLFPDGLTQAQYDMFFGDS
jgi:hypothetical protein